MRHARGCDCPRSRKYRQAQSPSRQSLHASLVRGPRFALPTCPLVVAVGALLVALLVSHLEMETVGRCKAQVSVGVMKVTARRVPDWVDETGAHTRGRAGLRVLYAHERAVKFVRV